MLKFVNTSEMAICVQTGRSMVTVHSTLLEGIGDEDLDQSSGHGLSQEGSTENLSAKSSMAKRRANMQETEGLYFTVSPSSVNNNGKEYFTLPETFKLAV